MERIHRRVICKNYKLKSIKYEHSIEINENIIRPDFLDSKIDRVILKLKISKVAGATK